MSSSTLLVVYSNKTKERFEKLIGAKVDWDESVQYDTPDMIFCCIDKCFSINNSSTINEIIMIYDPTGTDRMKVDLLAYTIGFPPIKIKVSVK